MYTVVLASQKGGSGKTTLSGHLAVEADRMGAGPVALIDTDPQGSLAQWWNARAQETPHFVKVGLFDLEEALAHLARTGFKLAVIDTPPAITDQISHVVATLIWLWCRRDRAPTTCAPSARRSILRSATASPSSSS